MTFRFYRAATIGDGRTLKTAFRSKLANYIDGRNGTFDDWSNRNKPVRFCFAQCEPILHATIEADPDVTALSPQFTTMGEVEAWLDAPVNLSAAISQRVQADDMPIAGATTHRQMWRQIARQHFVIHRKGGSIDDAETETLCLGGLNFDG